MVPDSKNLLIKDERDGLYEHHSKFYNEVIVPNQAKLYKEMRRAQRAEASEGPHFKTVDLEEMYQGLLLQTD